jgi:O-antigen ligase
MTGRTDLWEYLIDAIRHRPVFGYGYEAFFSPESATGQGVIRALNWDVGMAHNGFLEFALNFGLVGLVVVACALTVGFTRAGTMFLASDDGLCHWPLLIMIYTVLINVTEAGIARVNDIRWIVFVAAFVFATDAVKQGSGSCVRS